MKVYVVTESVEDGRGGSDTVVREVFLNENFANIWAGANLMYYDVQEFKVDESSFE